ncbi:MAG TPA: hypothetical protein VNH11_02855 [Pirellulales bacterium]|nr:hypothetical protein [Pirellulales bacterium]
MRFTLSIVAAVALAVAGLALLFHERAAAQQAAAAQREVTAAEALAGNDAQPPQQVAGPSTTAAPGVRPGGPIPQTGIVGQTAPQANYAYPPATTYSAVSSTPYGGWGGGIAASGTDPAVQELTAQDQQLESEVQSLAHQLADTEDEKERTDLKQKLSAALEKQFDAQQKLRDLEISRIEARVEKLRELVRKRTDSRRKIIDNRYEQLLNDAEGLGWNSTDTRGLQYVPVRPGLPGMPRGLTKPRRLKCV